MVASAPPVVLAAGAILSWPWQRLGLWGADLSFAPPTLAAGAVVILGALLGLMGFRLLRQPAWWVLALSTASYLTVGALARDAVAAAGGDGAAGLPGALVLRLGWLVLAMVVAVAVGKQGTRFTLYLFALFLAGEVTHLPGLEAQGVGGAEVGASVALVLALVVAVESGVVAWVIRTFDRGQDRLAYWVLLAVLVFHPALTTWQVALESGQGLSGYVQIAIFAGVWLGLLLLITFALHRLALAFRGGQG